MHVGQILEGKGPAVRTIDSTATVAVAVASMTAFDVGALVVVDEDQPIGLIGAREVLSRVVATGRSPGEVMVSQVMNQRAATASPTTTLEEALDRMNACRCRHLPVVQDGHLCGLISMGDITRTLMREREAQIEDLLLYITHG